MEKLTGPVYVIPLSSGMPSRPPHSVFHQRPFTVSPVWQSNFTQAPVGKANSAYSWLPLSIGPLTRNCIIGTQLHVSNFPLYAFSVKALMMTESLATVGSSPSAVFAIGFVNAAEDWVLPVLVLLLVLVC